MSQWVPPMAHYRATLRSLCGVWCAVCCCDRRSPLTLATTMFCRDRDRDRPTATDRPCQTFPFEENAGFAFRSRTQTISRESRGVFCIVFQIRHHQLRTQTFFLICLQIRHHHFRTQTFFVGRGRIGLSQKGREIFGVSFARGCFCVITT